MIYTLLLPYRYLPTDTFLRPATTLLLVPYVYPVLPLATTVTTLGYFRIYPTAAAY
jgi:hypothetical protein